jgi:ubiquinone biosynthesis protein
VEAHPLRFIRHAGRASEILTVLVSYGFGDLIERVGFRRYVEWGKRRLLRRPPEPELTTARRIRLVFEQLGPTFIKFGQVLSTRPDLFPQDVIEELCLLQEHVPPFPGEDAARVVAEELHQPIAALFAEFDQTPLAAGSLGQVHRARHHDGTPLAVKIRRPNAVRDVERDLALMTEAAPILAGIPQLAIFDPVGLVAQFARTIRRELNFRREGRTIEEFRKLFHKDATLFVPRVYENLTTDAVLTMQFVEGWHADDPDVLRARGLNPVDLARNGAQIYMKQVFEHGLFHSDPHPGNIRIREDGSVALLDYGMIGVLDEEMRDLLIDLLVAIGRNRVNDVVWLVQRIGSPRQPVDVVLLKADVHDFLDRYFGVPLEQLKIGQMLSDFTSLLGSHSLHCPGDLMLLIRTLVTLEGTGRRLDPCFNLAGELAPFIERVVKQRHDPRRMARRAFEDIGSLLRAAHDLPLSLSRTLQKLSQDDLNVQLEHRGLDRLINEFDRSSNRVVVGLVISALVVASALIIRTGSTSIWITAPIFLLSGFLGLWLIYGILRSGRL